MQAERYTENNFSIKNTVLKILNNKIFEIFIIMLIIINLLFFIVETDTKTPTSVIKCFNYFETISIMFFTVEYLLRLISLDHFKDLFRPFLLIDLLVILPFYLSLNSHLSFLRVLRLSRILRIFKLTRYSKAVHNILNAFYIKRDELLTVGAFFGLSILTSASIMYFVEGSKQEPFSSIPKSMWWAVITFTSVGYGDVCPKTTMGKIVASFVAILGVAIHGLVASVLISGFMESINKDK